MCSSKGMSDAYQVISKLLPLTSRTVESYSLMLAVLLIRSRTLHKHAFTFPSTICLGEPYYLPFLSPPAARQSRF
jgi:hypothetical protein